MMTTINTPYMEQIRQQTIKTPELISLLADYQMLPQLYRELLIDQAISDLNCSPDEEKQAVEQFYRTHNFEDESQCQLWLQTRGMVKAQLVKLVTRSVLIEKYKLATWGNKLESHFIAQKANLDQLIYSLLRINDMGIAQEFYFRIQAGEQTFAQLASSYSQGIEAHTGGLIGPVPFSQVHPQLAPRLKATQVGKLLPPIHIGESFVILRLEKILPAKFDKSNQKKLLDGLFQRWLNDSMHNLISKTPDLALEVP